MELWHGGFKLINILSYSDNNSVILAWAACKETLVPIVLTATSYQFYTIINIIAVLVQLEGAEFRFEILLYSSPLVLLDMYARNVERSTCIKMQFVPEEEIFKFSLKLIQVNSITSCFIFEPSVDKIGSVIKCS